MSLVFFRSPSGCFPDPSFLLCIEHSRVMAVPPPPTKWTQPNGRAVGYPNGLLPSPFSHLLGVVPLYTEGLFAYFSVLIEDAFSSAGPPRCLSRRLSRRLSRGLVSGRGNDGGLAEPWASCRPGQPFWSSPLVGTWPSGRALGQLQDLANHFGPVH
jgi:hypothetical protein